MTDPALGIELETAPRERKAPSVYKNICREEWAECHFFLKPVVSKKKGLKNLF